MPDVRDLVVTIPKSFGLKRWIDEGDLPGQPWSGCYSHFYLGGPMPKGLDQDTRVYVVYNGKLRGYAPLYRIDRCNERRWALVRRGGAVAVTIDQEIKGFRGFRYRWWDREIEKPFPDWKKP